MNNGAMGQPVAPKGEIPRKGLEADWVFIAVSAPPCPIFDPNRTPGA